MVRKAPGQHLQPSRKINSIGQLPDDLYAFLTILATLAAVSAIVINEQQTVPPDIGAFLFICSIFFFVIYVLYCLSETILRWFLLQRTQREGRYLSITYSGSAMVFSVVALFLTQNLETKLLSILLLLSAVAMGMYIITTTKTEQQEMGRPEVPQEALKQRNSAIVLPANAQKMRQSSQLDIETTRRVPSSQTSRTVRPEQLDIERREALDEIVLPPLFVDDPLHQFPRARRMHIFVRVKNNDDFMHCEDAYAFSPQEKKIALCDGTSGSNLPRPWAALLAQKWIVSPLTFNEINVENIAGWLEGPRTQWEAWVSQIWLPTINRRNQSLRYPLLPQEQAQQIIQQGAATTFLGLAINYEKCQWVATALGDTCLFLVHKTIQDTQIVNSLPYRSSDQFTDNPWLFSSRANFNIQATIQHIYCEQGTYQPGDTFLLATDALAAWIFSQQEQGLSHWKQLLSFTTEKEFATFVDEQRASGRLHDDDTSLIVIPTESL